MRVGKGALENTVMVFTFPLLYISISLISFHKNIKSSSTLSLNRTGTSGKSGNNAQLETLPSGKQYLIRASKLSGYVELRQEPMSVGKGIAAEFVGTLLVVLIWIATAASLGRHDETSVALALTVGFIMAAMITITDSVSGGHLNPAVTLGLTLTGGINPLKALFYTAAQVVGGIIGTGIYIGLTADKSSKFGLNFNNTITVPNLTYNAGQALGTEIIAGIIIVLTVLAVKDENRDEVKSTKAIAAGLSMTACHLAFMFNTGPGLNPARSFGPAVWSGIWDNHWVYWVGPFLGAMIAALLYLAIFQAPAPLKVKIKEEIQPETTRSSKPELTERNDELIEIVSDADVEKDQSVQMEELVELIELGNVNVSVAREAESNSRVSDSVNRTLANTQEKEKEIVVCVNTPGTKDDDEIIVSAETQGEEKETVVSFHISDMGIITSGNTSQQEEKEIII